MISFQFQYRPFIDVSIGHEFFDSSVLSQMNVVPDARTEYWLRKLNMVFKCDAHSFKLLVDHTAQDAFWMKVKHLSELNLGFWISYKTPYFRNVTANTSLELNQFFLLDNSNTKSNKLHASDFASESEWIDGMDSADELGIDAEVQDASGHSLDTLTEGLVYVKTESGLEKKLQLPDRGVRYPIGYVFLRFDKDQIESIGTSIRRGEGIPGYDYEVAFQAREVTWKYILQSKYSIDLKKTHIKSESHKVTFSGPDAEPHRSGMETFSFQSKVPLKLSEFSEFHFQLTEKSGKSADKILIKRLPVPRVDSLIMDNTSNKLLAQINVNL
ncbi:hypothetical protein BFP72_06210 [Reichenbachiella sp. 5M10]|uniref:hypothetical protein n=1 Tax=Reichenbachiella sp. 5M10 TaxID=1889772 RepID=UPI000C15CBA3|nr:hypothetical protein [Reichenbachiella sp. 5M10]PIB35014.1 hypothetical protein BFP72_06210 [Reichenbachiella sp. 5M10]